jgi:hypothetical protein
MNLLMTTTESSNVESSLYLLIMLSLILYTLNSTHFLSSTFYVNVSFALCLCTVLQVDSPVGQIKAAQELPPGWVEAKDPTSGASYFYNQSTGTTQWDRPGAPLNTMQHQAPPSSSLPENWEEALDQSTGAIAFL